VSAPRRQSISGHILTITRLDHSADASFVRPFFERRAELWHTIAEVAARLCWPRECIFKIVSKLICDTTRAPTVDDGILPLPCDMVLGMACLIASTLPQDAEDSPELLSFLGRTIWQSGLWAFNQRARASSPDAEGAWTAASSTVINVCVELIGSAPSPSSVAASMLKIALETSTIDPAAASSDALTSSRFLTSLITATSDPHTWRQNREALRAVVQAVGGSEKGAPRVIERFAAEVELL